MSRLPCLFVAVTVLGCSSTDGPAVPSAPVIELEEPTPAPTFAFTSLEGERIDNRSLLGRMSIIGMVATYDTPSQAQARFLSGLMRRHVPRINVLLLALEPPANLPLVEAFAAALDVPYPVAMADADTIAGRGPFRGMQHVPSVIVLDRQGRVVWRHIGLVREGELAEVLQRHDSRSRAHKSDGGRS